jgi:predicted ATPase
MRAAFSNDFEELVFPPVEDQRIKLGIKWKNFNRTVSAGELSDGILRFLFLITVFSLPSLPSLIAIDEPAMYLHPTVLPIIAEYAVGASERGTVVIFTTHSSQFLDAFEEITPTITVTKLENGETILKTIDEEELIYWLKGYSLGNLFRSGELENVYVL